jgi:hypothetical protein
LVATGWCRLARALGLVEQVALVVVEVAVEGLDAAARHQPELVAHRAQQRPVVADQHHRALELVQGHASASRVDQVEVVGRLVEQQQVGPLPDDHAQHQARLLAAAHGADRLLDHVAAES